MEARSRHYHFILFYHWRSYQPGLVPIDSCCKVLLSAPSATFNEMEEFHHIMKMRRHHKPWLWNTSPRPMSANHNNYMLNEKTNTLTAWLRLMKLTKHIRQYHKTIASQNFYQTSIYININVYINININLNFNGREKRQNRLNYYGVFSFQSLQC